MGFNSLQTMMSYDDAMTTTRAHKKTQKHTRRNTGGQKDERTKHKQTATNTYTDRQTYRNTNRKISVQIEYLLVPTQVSLCVHGTDTNKNFLHKKNYSFARKKIGLKNTQNA